MITNFLMNLSFREFLIWKIITISLLITISTEFLSYFNNQQYEYQNILGIFNYNYISLYLFFKKNFLFQNKNFFKNFTFELTIILTILILTLFNSLIYPPNTLDAMAYHMQDHALDQNGNINFYPTDDLRQLILAPFSNL